MKFKNYKKGNFNHLGESEFYDRLKDLTNACEPLQFFKLENTYFAGDPTQTAKQYLLENPSKSFYVWLIDEGLEIIQINN